jgi:hypothetical protein
MAELITVQCFGRFLELNGAGLDRKTLSQTIDSYHRCEFIIINEIHLMPKRQQELLRSLLTTGTFPDRAGNTKAKNWLTVIGTTSHPRKMMPQLHDAFPVVLVFDEYSDRAFASLLLRRFRQSSLHSASAPGSTSVKSPLIRELVRRCQPTPRAAEILVSGAETLSRSGKKVTAGSIIDLVGERCERRVSDPTGSRPGIPEAVRNSVWNRDGGVCTNCGSNEKLEFDHIIPVAKGGSSTARNLQLLCEPCNRRKGSQLG